MEVGKEKYRERDVEWNMQVIYCSSLQEEATERRESECNEVEVIQ
jgi:hypothetical protein